MNIGLFGPRFTCSGCSSTGINTRDWGHTEGVDATNPIVFSPSSPLPSSILGIISRVDILDDKVRVRVEAYHTL